MKQLFVVCLILLLLQSCKGSGSSSAGSAAASCPGFTFTNDMVATTYTGDVVTTTGNCNNGGSEYTVTTDVDYTVAASVTGWRLINSVLTTNSGNKTFTTGGRFQTTDGVNEGHGFEFTPVSHTTCQNAHGINGSNDFFELQVTASLGSDCVPRLTGTFREYSRCVDSSEVNICTGTITITK